MEEELTDNKVQISREDFQKELDWLTLATFHVFKMTVSTERDPYRLEYFFKDSDIPFFIIEGSKEEVGIRLFKYFKNEEEYNRILKTFSRGNL